MENKIVDLILPDTDLINQEMMNKVINREVLIWCQKNSILYTRESMVRFSNDITNLKNSILEKYNIQYDNQYNFVFKHNIAYFQDIQKLNEYNFDLINIKLKINKEMEKVYFKGGNGIISSEYFGFHEIELINKQYRLLQETWYSRRKSKIKY